MLNELSIKVSIADRIYPLRVTPEEEETVRQAAKLINDKLKVLAQQFEVKDKQDMLSMTVLELATQLIALQENNAKEDKKLEAQLLEVCDLLKDTSV